MLTRVYDICCLTADFAPNRRFPGAQPVSFEKQSIDTLLNEDYWVCEKTDGQRVLIYIVIHPMTGRQEVFLVRAHKLKLDSPAVDINKFTVLGRLIERMATGKLRACCFQARRAWTRACQETQADLRTTLCSMASSFGIQTQAAR